MPFEIIHTRMIEQIRTSARIGWNITSFSTRGLYGLTCKAKIGERDFEIQIDQTSPEIYTVSVFGLREDEQTGIVTPVPIFPAEPGVPGDKLNYTLVSMGKAVYDRIREARQNRGQDNPATPGSLFLSH